MKKQTINYLVNLVFFQAVWFLTVLAAANGNWWPGLAGLAAFTAVHYYISPTASADFLLAAFAVCIGFVSEKVFVEAGLFIYPLADASLAGVPVWMLVLWANFALIMNGCISWLHGRYTLAAVLGFAGAPLSYFGGIKLGAATPGNSLAMALLAVAVCYAVITPLFLLVAQRLAARSTE